MSEKCKICLSPALQFAQSILLKSYKVTFYRCELCGFVFTEEPYWLEEAYSSAITNSDLGLVNRNIQLSKISRVLISVFFDKTGQFVDYAGGYGLFVRLMRDNGFDFKWYDRYCDNIFARGFEAPEPEKNTITLVTAFEVFEHMVDPVRELECMLRFSRNILFTTQLIPEPVPKPDDWWYYGLDHGQHIAFFTHQALAKMANRFSLRVYSYGSIHLFTDRVISKHLFRLCANSRFATLLGLLLHQRSRLQDDYNSFYGN